MSLMFIMAMMIALITAISTSKSPVTLLIYVLMFALLTSTLLFSTSTWAAIILLIIYIGGLMVMFSYFVAVTPNQTINLTTGVAFSSLFLITGYATSSHIIQVLSKELSSSMIPFSQILLEPFTFLTLCLILLLILLIVAKVASRHQGALRIHSFSGS